MVAAPTMAVLPSEDSATDMPCPAFPTASVPTSLLPCWLQTSALLRVKTQAAPVLEWSSRPPMIAVLPSPDSATDHPWLANPTVPVASSFDPCCVNWPRASCDEESRPTKIRSDALNNFDNLECETRSVSVASKDTARRVAISGTRRRRLAL